MPFLLMKIAYFLGIVHNTLIINDITSGWACCSLRIALVRSRYCAAFSSSIITMLQSWWIATSSSSHFLVLLNLIIISRQLCLSLDVVFTLRSQVMSTSFWNIVVNYGACSYQFLQILITAKNNLISTNFLVWKFCGKTQFPHSFWRFTVPVMPFHKISTPGN